MLDAHQTDNNSLLSAIQKDAPRCDFVAKQDGYELGIKHAAIATGGAKNKTIEMRPRYSLRKIAAARDHFGSFDALFQDSQRRLSA